MSFIIIVRHSEARGDLTAYSQSATWPRTQKTFERGPLRKCVKVQCSAAAGAPLALHCCYSICLSLAARSAPAATMASSAASSALFQGEAGTSTSYAASAALPSRDAASSSHQAARAPRWLLGLPALAALGACPKPALALQHSGPNNRDGNFFGGGGGGGPDGAPGQPGHNAIYTLAAAKAPIVLTLASFAVTKLAYVRITKLFREHYHSITGEDVRFRLTFAGSGVQVRSAVGAIDRCYRCTAPRFTLYLL